jgi:hypothetical protein
LIALCARRIGATLITYNGDDFRLIGRSLSGCWPKLRGSVPSGSPSRRSCP